MAAKSDPKLVLDEGDFTTVQDAGGVVQEHPVPKAWVGTRLLPQGWKAATSTEAKKADDPKK